jgi:ADP-heptose:LPS heptosyltransferase
MRAPAVQLSEMPDVRSILVVRLQALGDIVLSLPIVYALRESFPRARIGYLCRPQYAEALSGVATIDDVLVLPKGDLRQGALALALRGKKTDCVIDLIGTPRSARFTFLTGARIRIGMDTGRRNWCYHYLLPRVIMRDGRRIKRYTLESNLELIGELGLSSRLREAYLRGEAAGERGPRRPEPEWLAIGFPAAARESDWAAEYARGIGGDRSAIVGILPGSVYQAKSWPEEHFVELAKLVSRKLGCIPLVLWGPGEEELASRIAAGSPDAVLAPPMGIARLGALISRLSVLVGTDSGPKHIAVVEGVATVTLFGPTDPAIWDPLTLRHRALDARPDCAPCRKKTCEPNVCLAGISPERVIEEIADVLSTAPPVAARGK